MSDDLPNQLRTRLRLRCDHWTEKERRATPEWKAAGLLEAQQAEIARLREALDGLQNCERIYRKEHDLKGDGHIDAGRAWDRMRRAGDRARATLEGKQ